MSKSPKEPAFWVPPQFDTDGVQSMSGISQDGKEHPDPVNAHIGLDAPVLPQHDILATIRQLMDSEALRRKADEEGWDTPEEADDFEDWEDEFEYSSYQKSMMEKDLNPAQPASQAAHAASTVEPVTGEAAVAASPSLASRTGASSDHQKSAEGVSHISDNEGPGRQAT